MDHPSDAVATGVSDRGFLYLHLHALCIHITHCVSLVRAVGEAAERTQSHLLLLTVQQPVLLMTGTGPGAQLLRVHQQVSWCRARLLQVGLDVSLAAGLLAAQTHFPDRQRGASSAEDAVQHRGDLVAVKSIESLHNVGKLEVLLQGGLLVVVVVAFWTADGCAVFGPCLRYATPAEVVLAWQLDWLIENIQADGTKKLLFEAVFPALIHDFREIRAEGVQLKSSNSLHKRFNSKNEKLYFKKMRGEDKTNYSKFD